MSHNLIKDLYYSLFPNADKYLTFSEGRSNIILSAPHGGDIKPINIPCRKLGNRSKDTYTRRLIQRIIEKLNETPYYIYADIHRNRVDLNRDIEDGCQGNEKAERIWLNWNTLLKAYTSNVKYLYKKGLYIDIHSHNNSNEFQIGYGLNVRDYLILLDDKRIPTKNSTMHSLKEYLAYSYKSEHSVLFGDYSIYQGLQNYGYKVAMPKNDKTFLNGGRNIQEFSGNGIGALQIECPIYVLSYDLENVSNAIANSIELFKKQFLEAN